MTREFAAAEKTLDRAVALDPDSLTLWELKAKLAFAARGDIGPALEAVRRARERTRDAVTLAKRIELEVKLLYAQRKFDEALRVIDTLPDADLPKIPGVLAEKYGYLGLLKKRLGDEEGARAALLRAREFAEAQLGTKPGDAIHRGTLARTLALLGEHDAARAEARRAMELLPESKDAFKGPDVTEAAAEVYALVGDRDRAFELLDHLMSVPSSLTLQLLKSDPQWDPLRDDPRLQALIDKYAA